MDNSLFFGAATQTLLGLSVEPCKAAASGQRDEEYFQVAAMALSSVTRALAMGIALHKLCDVQARQLLKSRVRLGERQETLLLGRINRESHYAELSHSASMDVSPCSRSS